MVSKFLIQKIQPEDLNYKNILLLRKFISPEGKILPRRLTGLTTKQQRIIAKAIKNARIMGFLPFIRIALY
uniref:Small ribosomal subunit protein bS18c n=1 Tax=Lambia antarctica TaxID=101717 RepID=A0A1L2EDW8_9CHLO|nr:30S ribosomal protein S18 [Lambia antarctica]ANN39054.1 30S ribosomal protein S18 [Lambia antarctica]